MSKRKKKKLKKQAWTSKEIHFKNPEFSEKEILEQNFTEFSLNAERLNENLVSVKIQNSRKTIIEFCFESYALEDDKKVYTCQINGKLKLNLNLGHYFSIQYR